LAPPSLVASQAPRSITVDHGTEFMSRPLEDWAYRRGVQLDFIWPGKPVEQICRDHGGWARNLGKPINNGPFTLLLGLTSCGNRPVRRANLFNYL